MALRLSRKGAKFIGAHEGFSPIAYNDPAGHATIGFGHLLHYGPVTQADKRKRWSRRKGLRKLRQDARPVVDAILRAKPRGMVLAQHELDALTSAGYNLGSGVFDRGRSLGDALRAGNRKAIASAFSLYVYAGGRKLPGLVRRRSAERRVFVNGYRRRKFK